MVIKNRCNLVKVLRVVCSTPVFNDYTDLEFFDPFVDPQIHEDLV